MLLKSSRFIINGISRRWARIGKSGDHIGKRRGLEHSVLGQSLEPQPDLIALLTNKAMRIPLSSFGTMWDPE